jgi:succinoglycan biosynthesis protein ExoH
MGMNADISCRISILRFLMIFCIVVLHTPEYEAVGGANSELFDLIHALFQNAIFRSPVPVLTFISGYLLFKSDLDKKPWKLAHKKFKSVVIPFLVFNLSFLFVGYIAKLFFGSSIKYPLMPFDPWIWANAAFGLTDSPFNYPLNFLRDLIVVLALAPLFGWLIRSTPIRGLIAVGLIFLTNMDGYLILRPEMPVVFYIGGLAAVRRWDMRTLDKFAGVCLILFFISCVYVVQFKFSSTYLRLLAPALIWPASSLLVNTRIGIWMAGLSKYTFFMFVAHAPVLLVIWRACKNIPGIPPEVLAVAAPVFATVILILVYKLGMRCTPVMFSRVLGSKSPMPPEPRNTATRGQVQREMPHGAVDFSDLSVGSEKR